MTRVAVFPARGLGDGLLAMILSHNLGLSGFEVTTFSSPLCELRLWFPGREILPATHEFCFDPFDCVIAADHSFLSHTKHPRLIRLREKDLNNRKTVAENYAHFCRFALKLPYALKENGLVPPEKRVQNSQRIALHPESSAPKKNWPGEKYIALAQLLEKEGWEPIFCVSPEERPSWASRIPEKQLPHLPTLDALGKCLLTTRALVGNDSGVGHFASNLGIPTLSLFARKRYARFWRPGWGDGEVITPHSFLPGARLKEKYWKRLLSVTRVQRKLALLIGKNRILY